MALNLSLTTLYVSFELLDTPHINEDNICDLILNVKTDEHYASLPHLFEEMIIGCHTMLHHNRSASAHGLLMDTLAGNTSSTAIHHMIDCRDKYMLYLETQFNPRTPASVYRKCKREHTVAQRFFAEQHNLLTGSELDYLIDLAEYTDYHLQKHHGIRHTQRAPRM